MNESRNRLKPFCRIALCATMGGNTPIEARFVAPTSQAAHFVSLSVFPREITLLENQESHHILVSGVRTNGLEEDLTLKATFVSTQPGVASVSKEGLVRAVKAGSTIVKARVGDKTAAVRLA